jgi:glycosyltransferase involved in cell wall biosynthesis
MKKPPTVSVIIPTFDRGTCIRRTLESVLAQTFSDFEILVVDDGSTDNTQEVIAQLRKDRPAQAERIRYLFQRNQGKSVALNFGLAEASGEWIAFQDSDDLWLPPKLEQQFRAIHHHAPRAEACFTDARLANNPARQGTAFERAGIRYPGDTGLLDGPIPLIGKFWIYMQSLLLPARLVAEVGGFDSALWSGQDEDFLFRLSLHARLCCVNSPRVVIDCNPHRYDRLTKIRLHRDLEALELRQRTYEKWLRLSAGSGEQLQTAIRGILRGVLSEQANWFLIAGNYPAARRAAALAVRAQFTPGIAAKRCLAVVAPALARRIVIRRSRQEGKPGVPAAKGRADAVNDVTAVLPDQSA